MKITALVENKSHSEAKAVHGLSFYIETEKHKLLFDLGPDNTLFENAKKKGIDLAEVDTVIISHGHRDHGGALKNFLELNQKAKIYIQRTAFEPHFSKLFLFMFNVGLDKKLLNHKNIVLLDGNYTIDDELSLFTVHTPDRISSEANKSLYALHGPDDFRHEQNLIIRGKKKALFMGCGHKGVVNILENLGEDLPSYCFGGFHVYNPVSRKTVSVEQLDALASELKKYKDIQFYTCHCTGNDAFAYLQNKLNHMRYFSCGDELVTE